MSLATSRSNVCGTCGKSFKRLAALENHERLAHPKDEHIIKASCQERRVSTKKEASKKTEKEISRRKEILKVPRVLNKHNFPPSQGKVFNSIQPKVAKKSSFLHQEQERSRIELLQTVSSNVSLLKDAVIEVFSNQGSKGHHAAPGIFTSTPVQRQPQESSFTNSASPGNQQRNSLVTGNYGNAIQASLDEGIKVPGALNSTDALDHRLVSVPSTCRNSVNQAIRQTRASITDAFCNLSKKGVLEVGHHAQNGKCLSFAKNVSIGTYRCTKCNCIVDELDFLFSHDCSTPRKSKSRPTICRDCGYDVNSCSCTWRYFELVVREKDPSCNNCGRVFPDDLARKRHHCFDTEKDGCKRSFPSEMPIEQHVSLKGVPVSANGSIIGGTQNNKEILDAKDIDSGNQLALKPKNDIKCPYCKKVFLNDLFLNNHMLTHSELQKFDCFYCRQLFPSGTALKEHLKEVHSQDPEETIPDQEAGAIMTDSGIRWKCSLCPKIFSCKSNRRRHQMWHFGIRPHVCELCGAAFRQRWQVLAHKKTKRCLENRLKSENLKVSGAPGLQSFPAGNIQPNGVSDEIEEGEIVDYLETDSLPSTTKMISNGQQQVSPTPASQASLPESAAIPVSSLSSASQLSETTQCHDQNPHKKTHEDAPLDLTRLVSSDTEKSSARLFICQECGMCCKSNRNLMIHKRIHTGERPYSCSMCSLTFRQSHHRKAHMLSKHGVYRPVPKTPARKEIIVMTEEGVRYKCHYCTKVLASRSGRRKHERWHLGLRPHKCDHCGNTFKQLQHLKKHQMSSKCRGSPMKLMDPKDKKESDDNPKFAPLTSWHMMQVLAENHRKKKAVSPKGDTEMASDVDAPLVTDVRSALGLISKEELKAKEEARKLAEEASAKNQGNDENDNLIDPNKMELYLDDKMEDIDAPVGVESENAMKCVLNNEDKTDVSTNEVFIKEEVVSDIEEGEIMDMKKSFSHPDGEEDDDLPQAIDYFGSETSGNVSPGPLNLTSGKCQVEGSENIDKQCQLQCHICGQYYKTRQNLNIHMRIHTGERPHCCSICSKKFIQPHHLKAHLRIRHNIAMVNPSKPYRQEEVVMTPEGIRFKCQYCPKLLSSKNGRQKHERWHLGLRPHKCDVCGKAFKQSHHLKRHKVGSACIPLDQQAIKEEPQDLSQLKQEQSEKSQEQEPQKKHAQKPPPKSGTAQNSSDPLTNVPTTFAAPNLDTADFLSTKNPSGDLCAVEVSGDTDSPKDLSVKQAPPGHLEAGKSDTSYLPEDFSIDNPQPVQFPSEPSNTSLPKDLTLTNLPAAKMPLEKYHSLPFPPLEEIQHGELPNVATLEVSPSKNSSFEKTMSSHVITSGTPQNTPSSKFTLLEVPTDHLPSPKAELHSSLVKDLTCSEVLSELSSSDLEFSQLETPQGSADQRSAPQGDVAEEFAPQDLSMSSSKWVDLHCYE